MDRMVGTIINERELDYLEKYSLGSHSKDGRIKAFLTKIN